MLIAFQEVFLWSSAVIYFLCTDSHSNLPHLLQLVITTFPRVPFNSPHTFHMLMLSAAHVQQFHKSLLMEKGENNSYLSSTDVSRITGCLLFLNITIAEQWYNTAATETISINYCLHLLQNVADGISVDSYHFWFNFSALPPTLFLN